MNKKVLLLFLTLLNSCAQLPTNQNQTKELVLQKLKLRLAKMLSLEGPIDHLEQSTYSQIQQLPGNYFIPRKTIRSLFAYDSKGYLVLSPGDYVFTVMRLIV